jgi:hypothetical protein
MRDHNPIRCLFATSRFSEEMHGTALPPRMAVGAKTNGRSWKYPVHMADSAPFA